MVPPALVACLVTRSRNATFDRMLGSLGLAGGKPIRFAVPSFDRLDVDGKDETGIRRFLGEPGVPALRGRLLRFEGPFARRLLVLGSGALKVTFRLSLAFMDRIPSTAKIEDWADALVVLAKPAERIPAPPPPSTAADLRPCPGTFSKELEAIPEGSSFDCTCARDGDGRGSLRGTRVYDLGSDVCDAARHAGMVRWKGSTTVTVFLGGPCDRFWGSKAYGMESRSRRKPGRSMAFQQPYSACPGPTDPW